MYDISLDMTYFDLGEGLFTIWITCHVMHSCKAEEMFFILQ